MKRVLVTGAAGFIGSNLVHYLVAQRPDWDVTALDLLTYAGNLENIAVPLRDKKIKFVKADILDDGTIGDLCRSHTFDFIFHLAAESHVDRSIHGAMAFARTNVLGTQNLLDHAMANGVKRFVHISTDEVYGSLGPTGRFVETTPLDPSSPYSASKAASDLMVLAAWKTHKYDAIVTRCTNNYGPYQFPEKLIPLFITNALEGKKLPLYGDGMNVRSWLHVMDHCEALLKVAEGGQAGEVYNIGGSAEAEIPNRDVTYAILKLLGKSEDLIQKVADRPGHDRRYAIDYSKIKSHLGWSPRTSFADGLKSTVEWYLNNRAWWERIKTGEYLKFYDKNYGDRK
ncbi:MAG: dTDP-glucose 4,6-dehydratase [Deltaproteobacteria bacterium]|nr:dTDP-glucose 4,6-dehydratase [Deltaproteobacteria bacterium]